MLHQKLTTTKTKITPTTKMLVMIILIHRNKTTGSREKRKLN